MSDHATRSGRSTTEKRDPDVSAGVEQHYRAKSLSKRLGISESYAKKLLARGEFDIVRAGTAVIVGESAVLAYLDRNRVPARTGINDR